MADGEKFFFSLLPIVIKVQAKESNLCSPGEGIKPLFSRLIVRALYPLNCAHVGEEAILTRSIVELKNKSFSSVQWREEKQDSLWAVVGW